MRCTFLKWGRITSFPNCMKRMRDEYQCFCFVSVHCDMFWFNVRIDVCATGLVRLAAPRPHWIIVYVAQIHSRSEKKWGGIIFFCVCSVFVQCVINHGSWIYRCMTIHIVHFVHVYGSWWSLVLSVKWRFTCHVIVFNAREWKEKNVPEFNERNMHWLQMSSGSFCSE